MGGRIFLNQGQGVHFQPVTVSSKLAKNKHVVVRIVEPKNLASRTGKENDRFVFGSQNGGDPRGSSTSQPICTVPRRPSDEPMG